MGFDPRSLKYTLILVTVASELQVTAEQKVYQLIILKVM